MEVIYILLIVFLGVPAALLIGCAVLEASLMKKRPLWSWLLPAGAMLVSALIESSDLDALLLVLPTFYGRCAFFGTAAGAVIGAVMNWSAAPS